MDWIDRKIEKYGSARITKFFMRVCTLEAVTWAMLISAMIWIRSDREGLAPTLCMIVVGNIHGLFFTLYMLLVVPARRIFQWDDEDFVFALLSGFFPFATLWVEKKLAKPLSERSESE